MTEFEITHGLSQDEPGPLEPLELAKVPAAKQYRKKPVVVQAVQYPCAHPALQRCSCDANSACSSCGREFIMTLEGPLNVSPGDWIITGVQGEHYPCKPDIFAATYEEAAAPVSTVAQGDAQDERAFGDEVHVLVPVGLLGAACSAIDIKRNAPKTLAELRRYTTGDLSGRHVPAPAPAPAVGDARKELTPTQIEAGWHQTFSTSNPYCPCNLKSFTKAVRWAECAIAAQRKGGA
ncbi:hypothetical protein AVE30378_01058 [Achromobacter veterisilvae]|uniref:Uncharacterized protein n=1 Tax=Achromobacter veterisilvae TaxID=2069367 RepID=A0A446C943_9BURK|nr:hypothetical protein [Achromobacter veterisilvae]SSW64356.1 hypothetical protein AVE30378_01058 [Achromobacter veterisilvae]